MSSNFLDGELVRLSAEDPQTMAENFSRWTRNSAYWRLANSDPSRPISARSSKQWIEKALEKEHSEVFFTIRTLANDRIIGDIGLDGIQWSNGDAFVGISIGEPGDWGKGYGTDAMRIILRYAFHELNLHRVSLTVFDYNPRAIRSYQKAGFREEGRVRGLLHREGRRWDMLFMGVLREEWEELMRCASVGDSAT